MKNEKREGENDMNAIAKRITASPSANIAELARTIKTEAPTLADLNAEQLEQIARLVITQRLSDEMNKAVNLAGIDYKALKEKFLNNAGRTESPHTRTAYRAGIDRLDAWAAAQGINPLELTTEQADEFINSLKGKAAASVRLDAAAVSSFFTKLHRWHKSIENPFRGSNARPPKRASEKIEAPDGADVKTILSELPAYEKAAAAVMALRGLRVGALNSLSINGARFTAHSKGKDITGTMPAAAIDAVKAAGLPLRCAFSKHKTNTLQKRVERAVKKLHKDGKIDAAYSCHDLRHYFAITEYRKNKDIHKLCKLLGHSSIQITETYLKGLGEAD
jgi:site-specific recombinase XerD